MRHGLACEDCGEVLWISQGLVNLRWLRDREHIVREVAEHSSSGLETWMNEGLAFLDQHLGHRIVIASEKNAVGD